MKKTIFITFFLIFLISNVVSALNLTGFGFSDLEDGTTTYIGYTGTATDRDDWYIRRLVESGTITTVTYTKGSENYRTNWNTRSSLTYYPFDELYNQ